ncbi:ribosome modulation factor [Teredinibacter waterburyi]|uniref:ribosome modulation factor n=1 Tax=Teredinibacter waterburyi TaxID=1500538 RepID=UPI00165F1DA5|nr:ribosome modulation factor [Teredinibacter waterburyi]
MKSQKRSHSERAFARGYRAAVTGKSRTLCPHVNGDARQEWLTGWREGREDHWNGFNTLAQVQKLQNM